MKTARARAWMAESRKLDAPPGVNVKGGKRKQSKQASKGRGMLKGRSEQWWGSSRKGQKSSG